MKDITKILAVSVLSMILLISSVASQPDDIPQYPMILYGTVQVNGQNAPVGTIISAYDGNTLIGTVTTQKEGQYGEDSAITRLAVNEPSPGVQIKIFIQTPIMSSSVEANEVLGSWNTGEVVKFDLSAEFTGSSSGPDLSSSRGGSSSSGLSVGTEEKNNNGIAMPGGSGVDTGLSQNDNQKSPESASSSDTGGSDYSLLIILITGVIALLGLFYGRQKKMF